jgi:hypothetical protein
MAVGAFINLDETRIINIFSSFYETNNFLYFIVKDDFVCCYYNTGGKSS